MAAPNQPQRQGNSTKSLADNYEYVCELRASGSVPVAKYRSKRTGLHIVLARIEGPLVNGYFTVGKFVWHPFVPPVRIRGRPSHSAGQGRGQGCRYG